MTTSIFTKISKKKFAEIGWNLKIVVHLKIFLAIIFICGEKILVCYGNDGSEL